MLGDNLPVSAPLQSYSKLDYMFEIHLVTYTENIQEEQEKKGFNQPILRTNCLNAFYLNFFSFFLKKKFFFSLLSSILPIQVSKKSESFRYLSRKECRMFFKFFFCRFSNCLLFTIQEWMGRFRVFSI